jgi:hypothetical protein
MEALVMFITPSRPMQIQSHRAPHMLMRILEQLVFLALRKFGLLQISDMRLALFL